MTTKELLDVAVKRAIGKAINRVWVNLHREWGPYTSRKLIRLRAKERRR